MQLVQIKINAMMHVLLALIHSQLTICKPMQLITKWRPTRNRTSIYGLGNHCFIIKLWGRKPFKKGIGLLKSKISRLLEESQDSDQ